MPNRMRCNRMAKADGPCLFLAVLCLAWLLPGSALGQAESSEEIGPGAQVRRGMSQEAAIKIHDAIYQAPGFGNTFMVVTDEGNVIVDTSMGLASAGHKALLQKVNDGPVKAIILTHGHGDHTGGVRLWKEEGTEVIAQAEYAELRHYQRRLSGFLGRRSAAQFSGLMRASRSRAAQPQDAPGNYAANIEATVLFDTYHEFKLGGLTFQVHHTPGETYGHASVWIPEIKAAFCGDNFYQSFPNMYTLRGTKPRWALDYVESLNTVLSWKPEILLPSHGPAVHGNAAIVEQVTRYRDAILHVHDATVRGMNAGKDVYTLMREIRLPSELDVGEGYGMIAWSVRGIYEGYVGWFDGNPANLSATPPSAVYPEVVRMAGGAGAVAARARALIAEGRLQEALHLADMALTAEAANTVALEARLAAFEALHAASKNSNEQGWLNFGIVDTKKKLEAAAQ